MHTQLYIFEETETKRKKVGISGKGNATYKDRIRELNSGTKRSNKVQALQVWELGNVNAHKVEKAIHRLLKTMPNRYIDGEWFNDEDQYIEKFVTAYIDGIATLELGVSVKRIYDANAIVAPAQAPVKNVVPKTTTQPASDTIEVVMSDGEIAELVNDTSTFPAGTIYGDREHTRLVRDIVHAYARKNSISICDTDMTSSDSWFMSLRDRIIARLTYGSGNNPQWRIDNLTRRIETPEYKTKSKSYIGPIHFY